MWQERTGVSAALIDQDWDWMVTFDNYPKQQWQHLRTTNPVESLFSALRLRTRSKIQESGQPTDCHLEDAAGCEKRFRHLKAPHLMKNVYQGARYVDGVSVNKLTQEEAA